MSSRGTRPTIPTEDGWYADSGGYLWNLEDRRWTFYGAPSDPQPREHLTAFAPFTRMVPERRVEDALHVIDTHIAGLQQLAASPVGLTMPDRLSGALDALRDVHESVARLEETSA